MRSTGILLALLLFATTPAVRAASSPDIYQDTSTQYVTGDTAVAAAAGQTVCAGTALNPPGTMVVDFFRADNIACFVGFPYSPWNVWIIDNLNATNSQGGWSTPSAPSSTSARTTTARCRPGGWSTTTSSRRASADIRSS